MKTEKKNALRRHLEEGLNVEPRQAEAIITFAESLDIGMPEKNVTNAIWLLIIGSLILVLLAAALTLMLGAFRVAPVGDPVTSSETVLMVFTTVIGFLAGMLAPSPMKDPG